MYVRIACLELYSTYNELMMIRGCFASWVQTQPHVPGVSSRLMTKDLPVLASRTSDMGVDFMLTPLDCSSTRVSVKRRGRSLLRHSYRRYRPQACRSSAQEQYTHEDGTVAGDNASVQKPYFHSWCRSCICSTGMIIKCRMAVH